MARLKLIRVLYATGLVVLPLSYALKPILGWMDITWVDPTLIVAAILFCLFKARPAERVGSSVLVFAFLSASIGLWLLPVSEDRGRSAIYVAYVEPIRLGLNLLWFWVSLRLLRLDKRFVVRWMSISTILQFAVALYLELVMLDVFSLGGPVGAYLSIYKTRQALWFGNFPVYRMAGTFIEAPPFGLFMFSAFVIFSIYLLSLKTTERKGEFLIWGGAACSLLGVIGSLSDQILLALPLMALLLLRHEAGVKNRMAKIAILSCFIMATGYYVARQVMTKAEQIQPAFRTDVIGQSGAEREFHAEYALELFIESPISVITGIGPGRYGDYAVRTGFFPSTVQISVTPVEWLVELGLLGVLLIANWLYQIAAQARRALGPIGVGAVVSLLIANMFQANWKWESWFLALAFLYSLPGPEPAAATMPAEVSGVLAPTKPLNAT